jgi:hypothetical protein
VRCAEIAVLVLDDHPLARLVAAALAADLQAALGRRVHVHDAGAAPYTPKGAHTDVLALVDLVHLDAEDWLVDQRCQVRLNVALGRPPRAVNGERSFVRQSDGDIPVDAPFLLEYSVDGHWDLMGLMARDAHFAASARSIGVGLAKLVGSVDWVAVTPRAEELHAASDSEPPEFPRLVPAGEAQRIYDLVHGDGTREVLLQVTTAGDWSAEVERVERTALELGFQRTGGARSDDGRSRALVLTRPGERLEVALAYMQNTLREASAQRQVLTLLHRRAPR